METDNIITFKDDGTGYICQYVNYTQTGVKNSIRRTRRHGFAPITTISYLAFDEAEDMIKNRMNGHYTPFEERCKLSAPAYCAVFTADGNMLLAPKRSFRNKTAA
jgi:hypothetical protein